jgi:amino acid adenylation domain-containing protein
LGGEGSGEAGSPEAPPRALLLFPPGLDFVAAFFGCLYAGVIAVPSYPPAPSRPGRGQPRLKAILEDCAPRYVLTTEALAARVASLKEELPGLAACEVIVTEAVPDSLADSWRMPEISPETIAFLQYTSGSTSDPKGVMVAHGNLAHNEEVIREACGHDERSTFVSWLPIYHDMGLIGGVLQPLWVGAACVLMAPVAFLQRPARWLRAISQWRAHTSGAPDFAYDLCARKVTPEQLEGVDLSSWRVAFDGAEPVRAQTIDAFVQAFGPSGFRAESFFPCYGLAEATLIVSGQSRPQPPTVRTFHGLEEHRAEEAAEGSALVGCGPAGLGLEIAIADPETGVEKAPDEVGEIWVSGGSVAQGYWNRPEQSEATFRAQLAGRPGQRFLRTGDLGFLRDGELFVTGRIKDLIIVRGRNHYPQDLERTAAASHPALRGGAGAAFSVEGTGGESAALVQEIDPRRTAEAEEALGALRQALAEEHEIPLAAVLLVKTGTVPKTTSGKVQRQLCRRQFLEGHLQPVASWRAETDEQIPEALAEDSQDLATWLRHQVAAKLNLRVADVDPQEPLARYGLDSLTAVELAHEIETTHGIDLPLSILLESPSLATLSLAIQDRRDAPVLHPTPLAATMVGASQGFNDHEPAGGALRDRSGLLGLGDAPTAVDPAAPWSRTGASLRNGGGLSAGERALWFLQQLEPASPAYHIAGAARLSAGVDLTALRRAFQALVDRHPALRTTFHVRDGEPVREIHAAAEVDFRVEPAGEGRIETEVFRPFDLENGPLLRARVFEGADGARTLLLVLHHLIADFWSVAVMVRALSAAVEAPATPGHQCPGSGAAPAEADLKPRSRGAAASPGIDARADAPALAAWQERLAGYPFVLDLPADHPRPVEPRHRAATVPFALDAETAERLRGLARARGTTLFAALLAVYQTMLHRASGQERLLVGAPTSGRNRAALADQVGYFVNTVVLPSHVEDDPAFDALLDRARRAVLDAFAQEVPFPALVERLQPERDPGRTPLFQTAFVFQKAPRREEEALAAFALNETGVRLELGGGLALESLALPVLPAQFDLTLVAAEVGGALRASLVYDLDLFEETTAVRMADWLRNLAAALTAAPGLPAGEAAMWSAAERDQVLQEWAGTEVPSVRPLIPRRVAARAVEAPEAPAIRQGERSVTYGELARRAHGLAWRLRSLGVGPETTVAVFGERRPETVVGLLAVLESGGAYVPIDPASPAERTARLVADSGARVLLTDRALAGRLPAVSAAILRLDEPWEERSEAPPLEIAPGSLAYVIYTSGSTGQPKGVQISHDSLRAFVERHEDRYGIGPTDVVSHLSGQAFDVSILDLWVPLANGACVWLPEDDEVRSSPALLWERMTAAGVTHGCLTTSLYEAVVGLGPALQRPSRLRHLLAAGERMRQRPPAGLPFEVWNAYGPTEATVLATAGPVAPEGEGFPSIGRPIPGTRAVLLDPLLRPAPAGAPGELCLGGPGLARGYLGRPEQTAERFVPDPFGPPGSRLYRTGDLARWEADGHLEFLRRIDAQVKIRGFRIEPGEIERTLTLHDGVRDAAVLAVDDAAVGPRLVAFVVPAGDEAPTVRELREHLAVTLPPYMVPSAFVALPALPLTPNGKIDRRALLTQAAQTEAEGEAAAPRDPVEEALAALWAAELGRESVGIHDDFFALGGHSLLGARIIARIRETFGADLALRRLFQTPTVAGIAEALRSAGGAEAIRPVPRDPAPPASIAQESLWFLDRLQPGTATYNVPVDLRWRGTLSVPALLAALTGIEARHEALRTRLPEVDGRPVQSPLPRPLAHPLVDLSALPESVRETEAERIAKAEARRPFDLQRGPLSRITLVRLEDAEHRLLWVVHHIVADGGSLGVWFAELTELYRTAVESRPADLPALAIQPADAAVHEREALASGALEPQLAFWQRTLAGAPVLEMPADHLRPAVATARGVLRSRELPGLAAEVAALARRERATPFMALLASFAAFLSRIADQEDLVLGTPVSRRGRAELEPLIGFLVDTLAVRISCAGEPAFQELLGRTRRAALDAFRHADAPFEAVVERLHPERGLGRNPIFPVLFSLTPPLPSRLEVPGGVLAPRAIDTDTAKFDLSLYLREEEGTLFANLEAALDLFEPASAERLLGSWTVLVEAAMADPARPLGSLPLLGAAEREQLVTGWNGPIPAVAGRLEDLVKSQAERTPDAVAVIDGEARMTYRDLVERAARLADQLRALGAGPETIVAVSLPRTADLLVALLGVLESGAAYLPIDLAYPEERRRFMLEDGGAEWVIGEPSPPAPLPQAGEGCRLEGISIFPATANPLPSPACGRGAGGEGHLAYIIYTSGSTGRPKGVAVEHETAVRMVAWAVEQYRDVLTGVLFSTSVNFDPSVMEIFAPLSIGGTVIMADDALALPSLPARDQVTFVDTVPSALTALLEAGPLPPSVRVVGLAGEPLRRSLADRFYADGPTESGQSRELWNLYGPTEDTIYSTAALVPAEETREPLIGRPIAGSQGYVADRRRIELMPVGVPGELFIGGGGLVRGYWRRPDLTAERFVPDPFSGTPGGRLYRTGDKVRWRPDGQIEFLGRFDHQVKVRGYRIELGEVEAHLLAHPDVKTAAALALPGPGGALQLVAFAAPRPGATVTAAALRERLAAHLPAWYIPSSLAVMDALPLTPSGKTDRRALVRLIEEGALVEETPAAVTAAPRTPVEELLAGLWCELLGVPAVGIHDDFFDLGGHSLLATRIAARVRALLSVELPLRTLFEAPTVAGLAERVEAARRRGAASVAPPLVPLPRGGDFPLSFAQERLWFLHQVDPDGATYNMAGALRMRGPLTPPAPLSHPLPSDRERGELATIEGDGSPLPAAREGVGEGLGVRGLRATLQEIVHRHEALRTTFAFANGAPVQRIAADQPLDLPRVDLTGLPEDLRAAEAAHAAVAEGLRPFDLQRGPVLRGLLVRVAPEEHLLAVTMHHIVSDGWSLGVLLRDVAALYPAFVAGERPELPAPAVQVADFAVWQRQWLQGDTLHRLLDWWRERLAAAPVLHLPSDRPRPAGPVRRSGTARFRLPAGLVRDLEALGRHHGATLFMILLAGWRAVLSRWSGQRDFVIGAPIANRHRVEIEGVIGCFVNTLALRTVLMPEEGFAELLESVRTGTLGAYEHQDLPFEKLVAELRPDRALSQTPLFQVLFALQNTPRPHLELPGLELELLPVDLGAPKIDLALTLEREGDELAGALEYAAELFDAATVERLARHWEILLTGAAADAGRAVAHLPLLTPEEHAQLLGDWIPPAVPLAGSPLLHERFAEQARRTPQAMALRDDDAAFTYRELDVQTNRLAWHLISLGVRPGEPVGLGLERSADAIVAILGILKAGAAWLPLDPAQPLERLAAMAEDSGLTALVSTSSLAGAFGPLATVLPAGTRLVLLDVDAPALAARPDRSPAIDLPGNALAYVIYTSGSTGRPKGVCCTHAGVVNVIDQQQKLAPIPPGLVCSQWASLSFDASVLEIFTPYLSGGSLDVVPERVRTDGRSLAAWMAERRIGRAYVPPALLADFAAGCAASAVPMARLETGAEPVPLAPLVEIAARCPGAQVLDCYGPTEAAVSITFWKLPAEPPREAFAPIGRPIANTRVYVLSAAGEPAPLGVPGELHLAGVGLAHGYLGRPDLTAERFVPDPFSRIPGERMYRTGDLTRWMADGNLAFLGRVDDQVKIRGIRIEPGEIAAALRHVPGVREAVVAVRPDPHGEWRLVAWVVPEAEMNGELAPMLRNALRTRLPEAMIPSAFVALDALPLTPNGKVDRAGLPVPAWERKSAAGDEHVAPRTLVEEMLADLWSDLLGVPGIGVRDSFFDLGGHSLKAGQLVLRVRDLFGVDLPVSTVFEGPTIEAMAVAVGRRLVEEADPEEVAKILEEM